MMATWGSYSYEEHAIDVDYPRPRQLSLPVTFAFQPIVDTLSHNICSYEALVRGTANQSAEEVFRNVPPEDMSVFDADCRIAAIALATRLGIDVSLNLNVLPQSLTGTAGSLLTTIDAACSRHLALHRIVLEVTEGEVIHNQMSFSEMADEYRSLGFKLAIDDFGAGYSGLNLLADFQPDQIKLDRNLVRGIADRGPRQAIVRGIVQVCRDLGIDLVPEGIEAADEFSWLRDEGLHLFQGFFFSRPGFECLPIPAFPQVYRHALHAQGTKETRARPAKLASSELSPQPRNPSHLYPGIL